MNGHLLCSQPFATKKQNRTKQNRIEQNRTEKNKKKTDNNNTAQPELKTVYSKWLFAPLTTIRNKETE